MDIGKRLKELRKSRGYSRRELAEKSNISQPFISAIESGKKQPTLESLTKLASGLGISLVEFLGGDPATRALPPQLQKLIEYARDLTEDQLTSLISFIKAITGKETIILISTRRRITKT